MVYVPGGLHCGPDYMSKYSQEGVGTSTTKEASRFCTQGLVTGEEDSSSNIKGGLQMATKAALSYNDDICAVTFQRIKAEVSNDTELARLVDTIINTPHVGEFPADLHSYQRTRDHLHVQDGVPMYGRRVIVPSCLRGEVQTNVLPRCTTELCMQCSGSACTITWGA